MPLFLCPLVDTCPLWEPGRPDPQSLVLWRQEARVSPVGPGSDSKQRLLLPPLVPHTHSFYLLGQSTIKWSSAEGTYCILEEDVLMPTGIVSKLVPQLPFHKGYSITTRWQGLEGGGGQHFIN